MYPQALFRSARDLLGKASINCDTCISIGYCKSEGLLMPECLLCGPVGLQ